MPVMRAKMQVQSITKYPTDGTPTTQENLSMSCVAKSGAYPEDGSDEDNSFARWTPSGSLSISIQNPNLFGKFTVGQKFYLDFTEAS